MATIDITASLEASRYGEHDQWVSKPSYLADKGQDSTKLELRMYSKYVRREVNFTVLYQGPGGAMRIEQGGPEVPGPIGSLIAQSVCISAHQGPAVRVIHVIEGDVLIINGQRMVIVDDRPHTDYPRLLTEVEVGINAALAIVRERLSAALAEQPGTVTKEASRIALPLALLTGLRRDIANLAGETGELRQRYAAPPAR